MLQTATLLALLGGIFALCRYHLDTTAAVLARAIVAAYSGLHGNGTGTAWSYHGTIALAYYLWGRYALSRGGGDGRRWPWLVVAGAAFAACLLTTALYDLFLRVVTLHYLAMSRPWRCPRRFVPDVLLMLAGGLAVVLGLEAMSSAGGEPFAFWLCQFLQTASWSS